MLTIVTGVPGSGKTLLTIAEVKALSEKKSDEFPKGREVYYHGIKELKLPWREIDDPKQWFTVPVGSIVLLDEAQSTFRPRHYSGQVPDFVAKLETHRHEGVDLVLVTQHPGLLDKNVRLLCGRHVHYVRQYGTALVKKFVWGEYKEDVQSRSDAEMTLVPYPKEIFKLYKSAEVHTHKPHIPPSAIKFAVLLVLLPLMIWFTWHKLQEMQTHSGGQAQSLFGHSEASKAGPGLANPPGPKVETPAEFAKSFVPRVASLAYTAPVYDKLTAAKSAPTPAGCVSAHGRCTCYTEQGTPLDGTTEELCTATVAHGLFHYWANPDRDRRGTDARSAAAPPPAPVQAPGGASSPSAPLPVQGVLAGVPGASVASVGPRDEGRDAWLIPQ